ncbi:hypothetical protein [Methanobacterium sp.]|uniref:hypothetical protein n=1 Tax=Methanobacterium sp. TaxID=2164 RepID=UPI002ABBCFC6|nr:hypothetical protein [Methanobacterium sp.]MDY9922934.1 hypothetical protein [Methanobacterium sp.]
MRSITHYAHGLNIKSELFFPEFPIKETSNVDVFIRFGKTNLSNSISSKNIREVYLSKFTKIKITSGNLIHLFWNDIGIFSINNNEIIINPKTGLNLNFLKFLLFGHAFAILLHLRGRLVLHANAINMDNNAIVISGVSGIGKSTISFTFHQKGYKLLCDDVLSINIGKKCQTVYPSFPRIKLWPDVIRNFEEDPGMIPKIHNKTSKRFYNVSGNFSDIEKQIKTIYFIKETGNIKIEEINPQKAMMELIKSSYCFKLLNESELSENLSQCSAIVNKVPVKILEVEKSYESLNKLVEIVEKDILKN